MSGVANAECRKNDKMTKAAYIENLGSSIEHPFRPQTASALQRFNPLTLQRRNAFTLIELIIVMGIIGLLLVLIAPAFTYMKSGSDFTNGVYGIQGLLENARTYAKANNTYVFVGFAEVDSSVDSSVSPQAAGFGRVAAAVVASKDGTRHFQYLTSGQGTDWQTNYADSTKPEYRGGHLTPVGKLQRFENLHFLVDFGPWSPSPNHHNMARYQPTGPPYILGGDWSGIIPATPFTWPLGSPLSPASAYQYRFDRVIYFDPTGTARIATATNANAIVQVMEIDLQTTHGTVTPTPPTNQDVGNHSAIQIAPMSGEIRVYRP
jgi:prepilin-type N-terminal cleavage/methylation domain-containing protein